MSSRRRPKVRVSVAAPAKPRSAALTTPLVPLIPSTPTARQVGTAVQSPTKSPSKRKKPINVTPTTSVHIIAAAPTIPAPAKSSAPLSPPPGVEPVTQEPCVTMSKNSRSNAEFLREKQLLLADLRSLEWTDTVDAQCACNRPGASCTYRCTDCLASDPSCAACLVDRHSHLPFHRVEQWTGAYFERCWLVDIGLKVHLGHGGEPCPRAESTGDLLTVAHVNGLHSVLVFPCHCHGAHESEMELCHQLMRSRIFPSTFSRPTTAYTFELMAHWHLESLQSKKSTWDYWQALWQKTKRGVDRKGYHGFVRAGRFWRVLKMSLRSGQSHGIDDHLPENRWPGSVVVTCPACPEPGFNLQPDWEDLVAEQATRYLLTLWHGTDATFKTYMKAHKRDPNDTSLLDGKAFYPTREEWEEYTKLHADIKQDNGTCPGYDKMHTIHNRGDREVSGTSAVVCIRHSVFCARGMVDLKLGEKYYMIDHGYVEAQGPHPNVLLPRGLSSDRACSLHKNIKRRVQREFPGRDDVQQILDSLIWVIPKMHIEGHIEECRYVFHLLYTLGAGRVCGEGVERPWVETNQAAAISKDANAGHRQEIYNDCHNFWNFCKLVSMAISLYHKAAEAAEQLSRVTDLFDEFCRAFTSECLARWEKEYPSEKARTKNGVVISRYRADSTKRPAYSEVKARLEAAESEGAKKSKGRTGLVSTFAEGIKLCEDQTRLRLKVKQARSNPNDKTRLSAIKDKRTTLRPRLDKYRRNQVRFMPIVAEISAGETAAGDVRAWNGHGAKGDDDEDDEDERALGASSEPENFPLFLPSAFTHEERQQYGISKRMVDLEYELREAHAETMLSNLRLSIRTFGTCADEANEQLDSKTEKTRARSALQTMKSKQRTYVRIYNVHLTALRSLDAERCAKVYHDLDDTMLRYHMPTEEKQARGAGSGKVQEAWFWRGELDVSRISAKDKKKLAEMTDDENRVRYFRLKGHVTRWNEELKIIGAEFGRTERHFRRMREIWMALAVRDELRAEVARKAVSARLAINRANEVPAELEQPTALKEELREAMGSASYASAKAAFYKRLELEARATRKKAASLFDAKGSWASFDKDLDNSPASDEEMQFAPAAKQRKIMSHVG